MYRRGGSESMAGGAMSVLEGKDKVWGVGGGDDEKLLFLCRF